jgi:simple sugar transport system permease protein
VSHLPPSSTEPADDPDAEIAAAAERQREGGDHVSFGTSVTQRFVAAVTGTSVAVTLLAIFSALVLGAIVIVLSDDAATTALEYVTARPSDFVGAATAAVTGAYTALIAGSLGGVGQVSETLVAATPLIATGLAVAIPLRAGLFNIGAEGQVIGGGLLAGFLGFSLSGLPLLLHLPIAVLGGLAGGAALGWLPGVLKARTGAHEVITTIMLNNTMLLVTTYLLSTDLFRAPGRSDPISQDIAPAATFPTFPGLGNQRVNVSILLVIVLAGVTFWLLERSSSGFELGAVGSNSSAATSAGMSPSRAVILAMAVGGAMAGAAGAAEVLGIQGRITDGFSAGLGFDGITVALLGRGSVGGTVAAGLLFGALQAGGLTMQASTGTSLDLVVVIQALIIPYSARPGPGAVRDRCRGRGNQAGREGVGRMSTVSDAPTTTGPAALTEAQIRRGRRFSAFTALLAVVTFAVLLPQVEGSATFLLNAGRTAVTLPNLVLPVAPVLVLVGLGCLVITGALFTHRAAGRDVILVGLAGGLFVLGYLVYAVDGGSASLVGLLRGTISAATPIALGALAGVLCERAGVINIAIEGQFLAAAFAGAVVGSVSGSPWVGLLGGVLAGVLIAAMLAGLSIRFKADQIVVGVVLIVFATGFTAFLETQVLSGNPGLNSPPRFESSAIPGLAELPLVGPLLFNATPLTYAVLVLTVVLHVALFHTRWGLRLRSVGEKPRAADTVGIDVTATRWRAVLLGGVMAGLGGAWFTLDSVGAFNEGMTGGRGFIALAAMLVGRYSPVGAFLAALLFGFATAFADALQILDTGVPSSLLRTAPYVITIFVVAGLVGRLRPPAANGTPYEKD